MEDLWNRICSEENFRQAWERVRANMGRPGIDRVSVEDFEANLSENLSLLLGLLRQDVYQPLPLLTVEVEKKDGGKRTLKIPSIRDRVVQEAFFIVLQPIFDEDFLNCSYGYRPEMSAHGALKRIERNIKRGRHWIVDADIDDFFDSVNRALVMKFFSEKVSDSRIIRIVSDSIKTSQDDEIGIPQGAVLSPLLANTYLHLLDKRMMKGQWNYVRFADDFVALCRTQEEAQKALGIARETLEKELLLRLSEDKTRVCHVDEGFVFLGYSFSKEGKRPSRKAMNNLKTKIEKELVSSNGRPEKDLEARLSSIIRGWRNYFKLDSQDQTELMRELDAILEAHSDSIPAHILKAALCINSRDREKAAEVISRGMELPSEDAEFHYQWGVLCDALNLEGEAKDEYYAAFRMDQSHKDAVYNLGLIQLQKGEVEKAIRLFQRAVHIDPGFAAAHFSLGAALERWGLHGAARKAFQKARELDPSLKGPRVKGRVFRKDKAEELKSPYTEEDIPLFLRLFSGREGVFSKQWVDSTGRQGYSPVQKPLGKEEIRSHLDGEMTLGLYLMRSDNTVKIAVIDIDVTKKAMAETSGDGEALDGWNRMAQEDANKITALCKGLGISAYIEDSGWKGRHCWFFFSEPIRAAETREFLKEIVRSAAEPPAGIHREIFPKQNSVPKDGLGSLVKLPLCVHRVTQRRALFVDSSGEPYDDQFGLLRRIKPISKDDLRQAIDRLRSQEGLAVEQPEVDDSPVKKVIEKCNVIRFLAMKAEESRHLTHYERLVLLHILGHLGLAGKQHIHRIIGKCMNYKYGITERWAKPIKPFPMSCPKIREMLSDITPSVGCYCEFPLPEKGYPSPVLHADLDAIVKIKQLQKQGGPSPESESKEIPEKETSVESEHEEVRDDEVLDVSKPGGSPEQPKEPSIDDIVRNYIELKRKRREIDAEVSRLEGELESLFQSSSDDYIQTYMGKLTRMKRGDETVWIVEI